MEVSKDFKIRHTGITYHACCWSLFFIFSRYDKREDLTPADPLMKTYSHVLMEANTTLISLLSDSHKPLIYIQGYERLLANPSQFPPLSVKLTNRLVLLESQTHSKPSWCRTANLHAWCVEDQIMLVWVNTQKCTKKNLFFSSSENRQHS